LCGWRGQGPGWWSLLLLQSKGGAVLSGCSGGRLLAPHLFMAQGCGDDMTKPNSLRRSSSDGCCLRTGSFASSRICPAKGVCTLCTLLCTAAFGPSLWSLSVATSCAGLCCRRHDFAAWIVGFLGRSGFSGNVSGGVCGRRPIRRQSEGVWDPDFSSGQPWFGGSARLWRPGLATLLIFPSSEHTQEWNSDPDGWDAAVENWLRYGPPSSALSL